MRTKISRHCTLVLLLGCTLFASCARHPPAAHVVWTNGAPGNEVRGLFAPGDLAIAAGSTWIVYTEVVENRPVIRVQCARADASGKGPLPLLASFAGESPCLLALEDGSLLLVAIFTDATGGKTIVERRGSNDGRTWSAPRRISSRPGGYALASGRLQRTARGGWLVAAVHRDELQPTAPPEVVCLRSDDAGTEWRETPVMQLKGAAVPAIVELTNDNLLCIVRSGDHLVRCESSDGGATWGAPEPTATATDTLAFALHSLRGGVALAWTDPPPDSTQTVPGLRVLRLAVSTDAGSTWHRKQPLAWRAGSVPEASALGFDGANLTVFFGCTSGPTGTLSCVAYDLPQLEPVDRPLERPLGRYSVDPRRAADALELLCMQTLERAELSRRLFIESYYMRTIVTAGEVLDGLPGETTGARDHAQTITPAAESGPRTFDAQLGLGRAITFADAMLRYQDVHGYWPLGYKALYVADMGAVVGLFTALAPHVDAPRAQQYVAAASRFAVALERDGMILTSGACGVGWPESEAPSETTAVRQPYLVSTSLAGIELHAWLYARTHEERYRTRALAALDYTLAQLQPDGSFSEFVFGKAREKPFVVAAYVEEGWMAADVFLEDTDLRPKWRAALPKHVDWLLRSQLPNGTWGDTGVDGEFARTPTILSFLIWYDQRVESREEVRQALRRASVPLLDPDRWGELGLSRAGKNEDVLRAITGRSLAAMAADRFVF